MSKSSELDKVAKQYIPAMTNQATHAVYAAKHKYQWGRDAAYRYAMNQGVHPSLYRLACQLQAVRDPMLFKYQAF